MERQSVSIVLCSFNGAAFIREEIDSILRQTYAPFELIISDDASTDNTQQVLQQYERDSVVRIFYQKENIGLTKNFAFAAGQAKGDLIAFSDQDDIWMQDKIEK